MPDWWAAGVFGWPGPILAIGLSVAGLVNGRPPWLVTAAVLLAPFSFYLLMTPRFWWGAFLPALPLAAAWAMSRRSRLAWVSVLLLFAVVSGLASAIYTRN